MGFKNLTASADNPLFGYYKIHRHIMLPDLNGISLSICISNASAITHFL